MTNRNDLNKRQPIAIYLLDLRNNSFVCVNAENEYFYLHYKEKGSLEELFVQEFENYDLARDEILKKTSADELYVVTCDDEHKPWKECAFKKGSTNDLLLLYFYTSVSDFEEPLSHSHRFNLYERAINREALATAEYDLTDRLLYRFDFKSEQAKEDFADIPQHLPVDAMKFYTNWADRHLSFDREGFISFFSKTYIYAVYQRGKRSSVYNFITTDTKGRRRYIEVDNVFSLNRETHMIVLSVFKDVTQRYEKQEERLRYMHLLRTLANDQKTVIIANENSDPEIFNISKEFDEQLDHSLPVIERLMKFAKEHIDPEDLKRFIRFTDFYYILQHNQFDKSQRYRFRIQINGKVQFYEVMTIKLGNDEHPFVVYSVADVNKDARNQIRQQGLLRDALSQAKTADHAKETFLSNMSHDLRTPMNAIVGFTEIALANLDDQSMISYSLEKIMDSSKSLLNIIDNILNVSRIESGRVHMKEEPISLTRLLEALKKGVMPLVKKRHQDFVVDLSLPHDNVMLDQTKVTIILQNVLENAILYTPENGHIHLIVEEKESKRHNYGLYSFKIIDDGIGMSQAYLKNIYDPFTREANTTQSGVPGTGLGMTITKNLVDMAGGHIRIESELKHGTQVNVELEFKLMNEQPPDLQDKDEEADLSCLKGAHILIVEDNVLNSEITKTILETVGVSCVVVQNGQLAVEACMKEDFQAVLMDIQMPVMNGYGASRAIRAFSRVPIIAMSANAFDEDKQKAYDAGMNAYITKPFQTKHLLHILARYVTK
jgi:signal transduction histidine kinase/BarA-like signal transduction histidine kinase